MGMRFERAPLQPECVTRSRTASYFYYTGGFWGPTRGEVPVRPPKGSAHPGAEEILGGIAAEIA